MTELPKANTLLSPKFASPLLLALIVVGLAGNYFKFSIFLNLDFIFGSIFAMLALRFFGFGRGIVAAAIIAGYTFILWNHPYAIIIMTAEVATVGWLMKRRKMGMLLADTLYWLVIGIPLIYLFYHIVMHVPLSNSLIIMTKQAINGIANTLIACLIFIGYVLRSRTATISYREIIYNMLAFFVLCPALIILASSSRNDLDETNQQVRAMLLHDSGHLSLRLQTWVLNRKTVILNLAEMAASRSPQQMLPFLELAKRSDVSLNSICIQNKEATTVAIFPLIDELGNNNIGKNFADRPYLPLLKQSLKPMLSEVLMGRFDKPGPIVGMMAPVVIGGKFGGYVFGILDLHQVHEYLDKSAYESTTLYTLLDKNGSVIMTNRTDQKIMTPFVRGKGELTALENGISQWIPALPPRTPPVERWRESLFVTEATIGDLAEWKLILEQPVAPFQKKLNAKYNDRLILLFGVLLTALALAEILSRCSVAILEKLRLISHDLPARLTAESKAIAWPDSGIMEAQHLISNFQLMADSLADKFQEIRQLNDLLEQKVTARTAELRQSRDDWENTFNCMPDMVAILDLNYQMLHANKAMLAFMEPLCQKDNRCYKIMHGLDAPPVWCPHHQLRIDGLVHTQEVFEPRFNKHLSITVTPVHDPDGNLSGSIHVVRDITERILAEEELANLIQEVESRNSFVESVITNLQSGIIVVDLDYRIKMVNSYVAGLCGVAGAEFIGAGLGDFSPELYENILNGNTSSELSVSLAGIQRTIGYTCVDLTDAGGNCVGYIVSFKDMTEIIRIRKELRQKQRLAAMGEVVAGVAHEMRNPLFGMTAAAQILEMELTLDAGQQELMDSLLKESRRLNNLVEELLHTTRETRISPKRVNLIDIVNESLMVTDAMFNEKRISLRKDYHDEQLWINADAEKLEQVILNLVKNALEASSAGGYVSLGVETTGNCVSVIVNDGGEGIPPENLDRIFDVFFTTKKNGTGMGLSICRAIVEAHGGSITAANNQAGGAQFIMQLPLGECQS